MLECISVFLPCIAKKAILQLCELQNGPFGNSGKFLSGKGDYS